MSCWVKSVVTFSVHVMLDDVMVTFSVLMSCLVKSVVTFSVLMSCWVKFVVTFFVHVMLGEVCGYLLCSCHVG